MTGFGYDAGKYFLGVKLIEAGAVFGRGRRCSGRSFLRASGELQGRGWLGRVGGFADNFFQGFV